MHIFAATLYPSALCWTPSSHWPTLRHELPAWGHNKSPTPTQKLAGGHGSSLIRSVQPEHNSGPSGLKINLLHSSWRLACCFGVSVWLCEYMCTHAQLCVNVCLGVCLYVCVFVVHFRPLLVEALNFSLFPFFATDTQYLQINNPPCLIQSAWFSIWVGLTSWHKVCADKVHKNYTSMIFKDLPVLI